MSVPVNRAQRQSIDTLRAFFEGEREHHEVARALEPSAEFLVFRHHGGSRTEEPGAITGVLLACGLEVLANGDVGHLSRAQYIPAALLPDALANFVMHVSTDLPPTTEETT